MGESRLELRIVRVVLGALVLLALLGTTRVAAQPIVLGGDPVTLGAVPFHDYPSYYGAIGSDSSGRGVVVYLSDGVVVAQRFGPNGQPAGDPIRVGTGDEPALAVAGDGRFLVGWRATYEEIWAQWFGADGIALGPPVEVATTSPGILASVALAATKTGAVAVWVRGDGAFDNEVVLRHLPASGLPSADDITIATESVLGFPAVEVLGDGSLLIGWWRRFTDGTVDRTGVESRRFSVSGEPLGEPQFPNGFEPAPIPIVAEPGGWAILDWREWGEVRLERFTLEGELRGSLRLAEAAVPLLATSVSLASDGKGHLLAAWASSEGVLEVSWIDGDRAGRPVRLFGDTFPGRGARVGGGGGGFRLVWRRDVGFDEAVLETALLLEGAGGFSWSTAQQVVREDGGEVVLRVERTGTVGPAAVGFETVAGSAKPAEDFEGLSGRLEWEDGDGTPRTVVVDLVDDAGDESAETFRVRLRDPSPGTTVFGSGEAEITIEDDDGWPGAAGDATEVTRRRAIDPEVAVYEDGSSFVVWADHEEVPSPRIMGRRFGPDGVPRGPEVTLGYGRDPAIGASASGRTVVAWFGAYDHVDGRIFAGSGDLVGEVLVFARSSPQVNSLRVAVRPNGRFAVVWADIENGDGLVRVVDFDPNGGQQGSPTDLGSPDVYDFGPAVATTSDGYLVAWRSNDDLVARRLSLDGSPAGPLHVVAAGNGPGSPDLARFREGEIVAVWQRQDPEATLARFITESGAPDGPILELSASSGPRRPRVAVADRLAFVVWETDAESENASRPGTHVWGRRLDAAGRAWGDVFPVAPEITNDQRWPAVGAGPQGEATVVWFEVPTGAPPSESLGLRQVRLGEGGSIPLTTPSLPGYSFTAQFLTGEGKIVDGRREAACLPETLCISGALPGRPEVFARIVGPKPNGRLWPTLVKFSTAPILLSVTQAATGQTRRYLLSGAEPGRDVLDGLFDREGFAPTGSQTSAASPTARSGTPPPGEWLTSPELPGYEFKVSILNQKGEVQSTRREDACVSETICVSGAVAGRAEVFLRVVGPKPNGRMWPTFVRFSTSRIEIWVRQKATGSVKDYVLEGAVPNSSDLDGLFDRDGFEP